MDTRTAVNRRNDLPSPVWNDDATAPQAAVPDTEPRAGCKRRQSVASLGLGQDKTLADTEEGLSPDPLRHTDLYRLVMPYRLHL